MWYHLCIRPQQTGLQIPSRSINHLVQPQLNRLITTGQLNMKTLVLVVRYRFGGSSLALLDEAIKLHKQGQSGHTCRPSSVHVLARMGRALGRRRILRPVPLPDPHPQFLEAHGSSTSRTPAPAPPSSRTLMGRSPYSTSQLHLATPPRNSTFSGST
ncbi:hypothetical protein D9613_012551 [Agrocybe pediades]|uniref:Uncharacterized protein n=1 Tax=Agrocybe pediades TaxID=84607 RepID=A0A8H4QS17_9AGAR|nr:hypothetical protein D9613_012551 [Agrocybe pediades]